MYATHIRRLKENWQAGLTVALISVPLSIALSIASGAGPVPGLITGVWATMIASFFGGNNYNIIGAAGALTTVLFAATLEAPFELGALVLPVLALATGSIILVIWFFKIDRFLYYIPSSVMYGFAAGVAFLIAASQLFDAAGLSTVKRTGTFLGDIEVFVAHASDVHVPTVAVFAVALAFILLWKRYVKAVPAVIPASILGIAFGFAEVHWFPFDLMSLGDKFGAVTGALMATVPFESIPQFFMGRESLLWLFKTAGIIALIAVLETLITAKIADKITRTQSSSSKELLGLGLANLGSGIMGGLPATGVFIRTGANIKAGATHRTSATVAAVATAVIALVVLPFFVYIPMAVIAAILVNTALGLIEVERFKEFWTHEKQSFVIAVVVVALTVFEDAGIAVVVGAVLALLWFADSISRGRFDVIFNFTDGSKEEHRRRTRLAIPDRHIAALTYSIAGVLGYIDSGRHAANLRRIANAENVDAVILRLRDLFAIDYEGLEMLDDAVKEFARTGKKVFISSASAELVEELVTMEELHALKAKGGVCAKTSDALKTLTI